MAIIGENAIIDSLEIQTEERMYPCSQCDQAYTSNILLVSHMKTHTEKPYQCSHCGKAFSTNKALKRHQKTHTGEKPYECINCGKAYTLLSNLKVHYRSHTGEKPYKCKYCSKAFSRSEVCVIHTRIHTGERPFRCNVCSKAFYAKSRLMEHMRTHTGEKPYKCTQCDKAFAHKTVLRDHELAHNQSQTGEKPYQCSKCNKRFALIRYLRNHVRRKHNTDNSIAMIEVNSESHTSENHEQSNNSNISIDTNSNATNAAVCIMAYASACLSEKVKPNSFQRVMDQYFVANNLPTIKHPVPDKDIIEYYSTKYIALNSLSTPSNTESVVPDQRPSGNSNINNINKYHTSSSHEMMVLNTNVDDDNSICLVSNSDFESAIEDNISEESNSNSQANSHVTHIKKRHQCSYCDRTCLSKNDLIRHVRIHTGEKPYKCNQCGWAFAQKYNLITHVKKVHGDQNFSSHEMILLDTNVDADQSVSNSDFQSPIEVNISGESNTNLQENDSTKHLKTYTGNKTYQCCYCDKYCYGKTGLMRHIRIHTGEKPYKCNQCGHAFAQKYNLTIHVKKVHGDNQKPSSHEMITLETNVDADQSLCHVSNSDFQSAIEVNISGEYNTNSQENNHVKHIKKRHQCSYCERNCLSKNDLIRHIRIHTGEKPYKCNQCGHAFAQKYNLTSHVKKVHGDNLKPSYHERISLETNVDADQSLCHVINSDFQSPIEVKISEKSQSNSQESNRIKYLKTDSMEKTHKCSHCDNSFHNSSNLARHMRIHTGEKPHMCSLCNDAFAQKSHLTSHQNKVHGETILTKPM